MDVDRNLDAISIARIAGLIGEAGRIRMLTTLLDGNSHSASELAIAADVSAQTASVHLAKLLSGGLITCAQRGRQRQYRLKNADVAAAIEALGALAPDSVVPDMLEIRFARSCYDHLAGVLAIALRNKLLERDALQMEEREFALTHRGEVFLGTLGIHASSLHALRRSFAHKCLDWTERHHHVGGSLGAVMLTKFLEMKWLARIRNTRALRLTQEGEREFERRFGLHCAELRVLPPSSRR